MSIKKMFWHTVPTEILPSNISDEQIIIIYIYIKKKKKKKSI